jgi:DNA primase
MEESEKDAIRARINIADLVGSYTALRKVGSRYKALCPFHQEKTPSFTVDPDLGRWRCFGACSTGGDIFSFLMRAEGLTFPEAAERLAERAGVVLTRRGGSGADQEVVQRQRDERERLYSANATALRFFREKFAQSSLARDYAHKRGLVQETIENFQIGFAPDDWEQLANYLHRNRIHAEDAVKAGLITPSRRNDGSFTDRFRGRLIFPIIDTQERVVGFGGRLIVDKPDAPKYLNSPETPVFSKSKILYALNRARKSVQDQDRVVVVEGYMDAVACHQAGIEFVVATLGTALTEEHVRLIRRYAAKSVLLSFDADEAGVRAALRAAELLTASGGDLSLRVLVLPPGEDPGSLLLDRGDSALFRRAIDDAQTVPEFRLKSLETKHNLRTEPGKLAYLNEAVPIIASVPSLLEQDVLIRRVTAYHPSFGTNGLRAEQSVRGEVERFRRGASGGAPPLDDPLSGAATPRRPYNNGGPRSGGGGGPTGYNRDFQRGGNNGGSGGRRNYNNNKSTPFVVPDYLPTPQKLPAAEQAERVLLRALMSEEWVRTLRKHLETNGTLNRSVLAFSNPMTSPLFDALWPLVTGGVSPRDALLQLADDTIADYAQQVLLSDADTELSEESVISAIQQLFQHRLQTKQQEIRAKLASLGEGDTSQKNELLRQYSEIARTLKGRSAQSEEE